MTDTTFNKWYEAYAPTAPETLDECVRDAWNAAIAIKQAEIDRLMLEYCPDEMTQEQIVSWYRYQRRVQI